jgi:hypothetical protein
VTSEEFRCYASLVAMHGLIILINAAQLRSVFLIGTFISLILVFHYGLQRTHNNTNIPKYPSGKSGTFPFQPTNRLYNNTLPEQYSTKNRKVIFYHIYLPGGSSSANALRIVDEQLQQMQNKNVVLLYNTVGVEGVLSQQQMNTWCLQYQIVCHHLQHYSNGNEEITLTSAFNFCRENEDRRIGYVHNKGSFHFSVMNENWRKIMTEALVREECWNTLKNNCNTCGVFFTADKGIYFAGNVWTADCRYIKTLIPPNLFEAKSRAVAGDALLRYKMGQFQMKTKSVPPICNIGIGRYANEWWLGSHPSLHPCDFSDSIGSYTYPDGDNADEFLHWLGLLKGLTMFTKDAPARRFRLERALEDKALDLSREYFLLPGRIHKWVKLYGQVPNNTSWAWRYYPDGHVWRYYCERYGVQVLDMVFPIRQTMIEDLNMDVQAESGVTCRLHLGQ